MTHLHIEETDDWIVVFVNGQKVTEGHSLYTQEWLGIIAGLSGQDVVISSVYHAYGGYEGPQELYERLESGKGIDFMYYSELALKYDDHQVDETKEW